MTMLEENIYIAHVNVTIKGPIINYFYYKGGMDLV